MTKEFQLLTTRSVLVNNLVSDVPAEQQTGPIPLSDVSGSVLKKVIEWCEHYENNPPTSKHKESDYRDKPIDIKEWGRKFKEVDQEMLFGIILVRTTRTKIFAE